jgi:hypothetical protein
MSQVFRSQVRSLPSPFFSYCESETDMALFFLNQACGQNEDRGSMILCSICDTSYHEHCLDDRSTPSEKVRDAVESN